MNESPALLHVWSVHPDAEEALVARLGEMFDRLADDPGFVSARILASADRTSVAAVVEMRSAEDRQRLETLPEVRDTLNAVQDGAFNVAVRLYRQVGTYDGRVAGAS